MSKIFAWTVGPAACKRDGFAFICLPKKLSRELHCLGNAVGSLELACSATARSTNAAAPSQVCRQHWPSACHVPFLPSTESLKGQNSSGLSHPHLISPPGGDMQAIQYRGPKCCPIKEGNLYSKVMLHSSRCRLAWKGRERHKEASSSGRNRF